LPFYVVPIWFQRGLVLLFYLNIYPILLEEYPLNYLVSSHQTYVFMDLAFCL
jgi:hypothetical protein